MPHVPEFFILHSLSGLSYSLRLLIVRFCSWSSNLHLHALGDPIQSVAFKCQLSDRFLTFISSSDLLPKSKLMFLMTSVSSSIVCLMDFQLNMPKAEFQIFLPEATQPQHFPSWFTAIPSSHRSCKNPWTCLPPLSFVYSISKLSRDPFVSTFIIQNCCPHYHSLPGLWEIILSGLGTWMLSLLQSILVDKTDPWDMLHHSILSLQTLQWLPLSQRTKTKGPLVVHKASSH